jgi:2-keto-4-pentenoate hydratase
VSISQAIVDQITESYLAAEGQHQPITPVASFYPHIAVEEAYQVQANLIARLRAGGGKPVGKKAAATSAAAQAKMHLTEPIYGHLFDFQQAAPGATLSARHFIQPFIECELGFVFNQPLAGPGVAVTDILAATTVVAAFDIIDFRTIEFQVGMPEALCYNVYTVHFVLGAQGLPAGQLDLPNLKIRLSKNGETAAEATGAAIMEQPARSIAWIANKLAEHQSRFEAGEVALTGAITRPQPIAAGDHFVAMFDSLGSLEVRFV